MPCHGEIWKWIWKKIIDVAAFSIFILPSLQFTLLFIAFRVATGDLSLTSKKMLYVFGSVGVVLLNSVTLMTELILKAVNGEHAVGDLRVVVFSSESLFVFSLLILLLYEPWISDIKCRPCCQKAARTDDVPVTESNQNQASQNAAGSDEAPASGSNQMQNTAESHEMETLLKTLDQEAGRSDMTEETPDSVETQT
ncbi:Aerobic cobaltochelatase subunit CobT [Labeo rohita]|uniref:Aerobic cobaltochelatase subunit CobT n=1 Tax=Labeo rohita TaxID=84645 RepID=A0ABQ8LBG6_LABRO|nr:Aerobic cobaltochelatase subunit CobT [Labeo rohita]